MRRRRIEKRTILPDPIYQSVIVEKLINYVMRRGKKSLARKITYKALDIFLQKTREKDVHEAIEKVLSHAKPTLMVKSKHIGGSTYQVPMEISEEKQLSTALLWLVTHAKKRPGSMINGLAGELNDCYLGQGATVKKRESTYRMAEANKAFAHFNKW